MLLVVSGLEENPGPAQHTLEDHPVEDSELAEVVTEMDDLKTKRTKCAVCAIGDLRPDPSPQQSMIVYTGNGPRRVKHVPMSPERIMGVDFIRQSDGCVCCSNFQTGVASRLVFFSF